MCAMATAIAVVRNAAGRSKDAAFSEAPNDPGAGVGAASFVHLPAVSAV